MVVSTIRSRGRILASAITRFLASERCFYIVIGIFVIQALWFAATARYPMAFDEDFHFGLIKLHATQWLPFFTHQPPNAAALGPVVRDPSYLYHFLMSIPYRGISAVTSNQTAQIITLRILNIAMFVGSLILFRRLLRRLGGSLALSNTVILLFALVPIVPFLAAHINYDNLFILLTVWCLLAVFDWLDDIAAHHMSAMRTAILLSLLLLASLVKYAFLPIAAGIGVIMVWQLWQERRNLSLIASSAKASFVGISSIKLAAMVLLVVVSGSLFVERYGINILRYHALNPDCSQILSLDDCSQYSPWERDYTYAQTKPGGEANKLDYPWQWLYGMWQRSFFTISDTYDTKPPLPVPGGTVIVLGTAGGILFICYGRRILRQNIYRQCALLVTGLYILTLFVQTYQGFVRTGIPVAVNGRYLVPFMPLIFLFVGLAFQKLWQRQEWIKAFAVVIVVLLFLQGGGVMTFIVESDETWDWPNQTVIHVNNTARQVLQAVVIGAKSSS